MFRITYEEFQFLRSQIVISKGRGGRRHLPYFFTEQGVAMLSSVLHSDRAIQVNIAIMREKGSGFQFMNFSHHAYSKNFWFITYLDKNALLRGNFRVLEEGEN
jgi:hypothetical protein